MKNHSTIYIYFVFIVFLPMDFRICLMLRVEG